MTSKKSSLNPMNYTYGKTLLGKLPLSAALCIMIFAEFSDIFKVIRDYKDYLKLGETELADKIKEGYLFVFKYQSYELGMIDFMVQAAMIIAAAILAINLFGFLLNKSSVNVIYSLGISRSKYFGAKLLAGITAIVLGIGIPMVIITVTNAAFFGMSKALITTSIYIFIKLVSAMLWPFAVFALTIVLTGSLLETIVEGAVVYSSPYLINCIISTLMATTAYGSPYTSIFSSISKSFSAMDGSIVSSEFSLFNIEEFLLPISYCDSMDNIFTLDKQIKPCYPSFVGTIIFLAVIIAIFVAATFLNSRRHAEKAGFMGTSPFLQGYCVVTVGPFLASFFSDAISQSDLSFGGILLAFLISAAVIMIIGYTIVDLICVHSMKKYISRLKYLGIELAVFAAVSLAFIIGTNIAYSSIPSKQSISSVSVSVPYDYINAGLSYGYGSYAQDGVMRIDNRIIKRTSGYVLITDLKDEEAIEMVTEINGKLQGYKKCSASDYTDFSDYGNRTVPYTIRIEYTLKSGRKVCRMYSVATDEIICSINEMALSTDGAKKFNISEMNLEHNDWDIMLISPNGSSREVPEIFVASNDDSTGLFVQTTERDEFFKAVINDILDGSAPLTFKSTDEIKGYYALGEAKYPIYSGMKNTLAVLEKYNLMGYLENTAEPVKISYCRYRDGLHYEGSECSGMVSADIIDSEYVEDYYCYDEYGNEYHYGDDESMLPDDTIVVTDPEKIAEVEKSIALTATATYNGSYAMMEYEDGTIIYAYMPDYIK